MRPDRRQLVAQAIARRKAQAERDAETAAVGVDRTVPLGEPAVAKKTRVVAIKRRAPSAKAVAPSQPASSAVRPSAPKPGAPTPNALAAKRARPAPPPQAEAGARAAMPPPPARGARKTGRRAKQLTEADRATIRMQKAQSESYSAQFRELMHWVQFAKILEQDTAVEVVADSAADLARTGQY